MTLTSKVRTYKWHLGALAPDIFRAHFPYCYCCPCGLEYPRRREPSRHYERGPRRGLGRRYGGNPLARKAAQVVLRVVDEEGLLARAEAAVMQRSSTRQSPWYQYSSG